MTDLQDALNRWDELDFETDATSPAQIIVRAARLVANPNIEAAWKVLTEVVDTYLGDDEELAFVTDIVAAALTQGDTQ
jgi:hypothetical protein